MDTKWLFVHKNGGWWLKVSDAETLIKYHEKVDRVQFGNALLNYIYGKEFNPHATEHSKYIDQIPLTQAAYLHGVNEGISIVDSLNDYRVRITMNQLSDIFTYGAIFINQRGGYHFQHKDEPKHTFIWKDKLIWPDFKKSDLKISQFPNGTHYYAKVGNVEVRNGDEIKWNSYEEAYKAAMEVLGEINGE